MGLPKLGRQTRLGWENKLNILVLCVIISKTVQDTHKVTIND